MKLSRNFQDLMIMKEVLEYELIPNQSKIKQIVRVEMLNNGDYTIHKDDKNRPLIEI